MKVQFSKSKKFTPEWNDNKKLPKDEQITVTLRPMRFDDLMNIMDAMGGAKIAQQAQEGVSAEEIATKVDATAFLRENGAVIGKYVSELVNLDGEDGPVSIEEVCIYPAFMSLAMELTMELVAISMPSEQTEGNSPGQPG